MAEKLDLVCGPADPLPESTQSFRLVERLGSGGQADVYKAVRQSGGVSSAPVTVKVFRPAPDREIAAQFRSWDKGDAVLMDLGGRGITGICRRIDAFYGPPPHRPGTQPGSNPVPYQVLEYLPGLDLRQLLPNRQRSAIDAVAVLRVLAGVLNAMHRPNSPEIHPSLHMDIKPSNVVILPTGEARVIDFTGARYSSPSHLTTISFTPENAGPEARAGRVGPSYDVHGFGSVAFFLVTGVQPRSDSPQAHSSDAPGWSQLRRHPTVDGDPRLRAHLLAPLSDEPRDRPLTADLSSWIDRLASIMRSSHAPGLGVDWGAGDAAHTVRVPSQTRMAPAGATTAPLPQTRRLGGEPRTVASAPVSPVVGSAPPPGQFGRGVAEPHRRPVEPSQPPPPPCEPEPPERPRTWTGPNGRLGAITVGIELFLVGALFGFVGWGIWALSKAGSDFFWLFAMYLLVLIVAIGVFALCRVIGTVVIVRMLGRTRRSARLSHLAAGALMVYAGIWWLGRVPFIQMAFTWISHLF